MTKLFRVFALPMLLGFTWAADSPPASVIVRSGAITLKVPNFKTARDQVTKIAESVSGHVLGGQVRVSSKGQTHGWLRMVVPASQLDTAMRDLRGIGTIYGDSLASHGLDQNVEDLASRTNRLEQHQSRLSDMLKDTRRHLRGSDILFVQDRLFRAGVDQDLLTHEREEMVHSANEGNISIILFEPSAVKKAAAVPKTLTEKAGYAFGSAWTSFSKFVAQIGLLAATVVVYSLIWIPVLLLVFFGWRKLKPLLRSIPWERLNPGREAHDHGPSQSTDL